jgi:Carboxypeptidase regulatory-like domain/TonB dependent receptor
MKINLLLLLFASALAAHVSSGSFYGDTHDQSGGLVADSLVTVREEKTGFTRQTSTDSKGAYRVPDLGPGVYSITAERKGFRPWVVEHVTLEINQNARVDLSLAIGSAQETVTVESALSAIQTDENSEGFHFDSQLLGQLPIDGRNILSLVTVGPGAIPRQLGGFVHDDDNDIQAGSRGAVAFNPPINGARPSANVYFIDGAYNTDRNVFSAVIIPPLDSVQEFRVQTSLSGPAFSQAAGGVIDIATKSGSRTFHGDAFEFLRNEATDAHNYFDDPTLPRPIFRQNQFGGSVGGPTGLPSTFFFVSYEGLRSKSATSSPQLVPNAAFRAGNFQGDGIIYDPLTTNSAGVRTPFSGNQIPVNRIDPIAAKYLSQYEPLPNTNGTSSNYLDSTPSISNHDSGSVRIDHQFKKGGQLFGRYTINDEPGDFAGSFPLRPTSEQLRAQQVSLGHTFSTSNLINEFRTSFTRLKLLDLPQSAFGTNEAAALGLDNPPTDPFAFGLPYFFVTDFSTVTDSPTLPQIQRDNIWYFSDTLTLVRGRHTWTIGADWAPFQMNYQQSNLLRGKYTYSGAFTADPLTGTGGDGLADFLLGYPLTTQRSVGSPLANMRQTNYGAFVQHDWRPTSSLSVNLGLRYEYDSPFSEQGNKFLNLDYAALPSEPTLVSVHNASDPKRLNFSPRVGMAWKLPNLFRGNGETVFRAAYGIYYNPEIADEAYSLVLNGIQTQINETSGLGLPTLTTKDGFLSSATSGLPSYFGLDQHADTPYMQQWNAGLQHEAPGHILLEASYIANKGTHLGIFRRFNTPLHTETGEDLDPRPGDLQSLRTFPDLGTIFQRQHIGNSSYQSLQLKGERRFRGGLTFLASFVWSKSIDDADSVLVGQFDSAGAQNENNLRLERGLSFDNVPRRFSGAFVYNLPRSPVLGKLLNNWQVNGIITLQDGTPLNPFYIASDFANTGTPNRPNIVAGQSISLPSSERTADHWFNTAAFSAPAPFTFGDAGRNIIPGPGNEDTDIAVQRRFSITERMKFQLRAEGFNIFNHPNYGIPGPYPDLGPFFGKILSAGSPRRFQFGTRFDF